MTIIADYSMVFKFSMGGVIAKLWPYNLLQERQQFLALLGTSCLTKSNLAFGHTHTICFSLIPAFYHDDAHPPTPPP
jgi:hypothetical protein